ncbi:jouberin-like isoform X2 [Octopus vulgaris]|uniref:Jouberin-like isoform X2 n=1 Tax=Octopus vulgaris TaxID=6645 RepID=A0AA36BYT3_OCTVU|nr:jouberin-like isoform X2 [Octopus vulgaris]
MAEDDSILAEEKKPRVKKKVKKNIPATDSSEDITLQTRARFEKLLQENLDTPPRDIKKKKKKKQKPTSLEESQEQSVAETNFTSSPSVSRKIQRGQDDLGSGSTKESPRKSKQKDIPQESELALDDDRQSAVVAAKGKKKVAKKTKPVKLSAGGITGSKDISTKVNGFGDDVNDDKNRLLKDTKGKKKKAKLSTSKAKTEDGESTGESVSVIKDEGSVLAVVIHRTDKLKNDFSIIHPLVRVHVVNENTGQYLLKQSRDRPVTFYYECKSPDVAHILPMMTQPFDFKQRKSTLPVWEELLLFNENYNYFVQLDPKVIVFFEIVDFVSMNSASFRYQRQPPHEGGWYKIAWAFLKVIGANQKANTDTKVRLQLFQPCQSSVSQVTAHTPEVYIWWKNEQRVKYPSTLYVTIKKTSLPSNVEPSLRSMFATQEEKGISTPGLSRDRLEPIIETKKSKIDLPLWSRLDGQTCRVPNTLLRTLKSGWNGCYTIKFSHDGRKIACGCHDLDEYPVLVYEVTTGQLVNRFLGHFGLIYAVSWSNSDKLLCSASADGTARIWINERSESGEGAKLLPHPAYVYCCSFHVRNDDLIVTGGYDEIIRIWDIKGDPKYGELQQEIESHKGYINAICFDELGDKMYSADSVGNLLVWNCYVSDSQDGKAFQKDWTLFQDISIPDFHGIPINSLTLHCSGRRLLVHYRDSVLRMINLRILRVMQKYIGALNFRKHLQSTLTPCGSYLLSGSEDNYVYVWNTETGDHVYKYTSMNYKQPVTGIDYHPKDHIVAFCSPGRNQLVYIYKYIPTEVMKPEVVAPAAKTLVTSTPPSPSTLTSRSIAMTDRFDEKDGHQLEDRIRYERVLKKLNSVSALAPSLFSPHIQKMLSSSKLKEPPLTVNPYPSLSNTARDLNQLSTSLEPSTSGVQDASLSLNSKLALPQASISQEGKEEERKDSNM